jgi:hypothetical protein
LGLVGILAVAGCGGSSSTSTVDASKTQDGNGSLNGPDSGNVIPPAGTLTIDKVSIPFGSIDVGVTSDAQTVTVTNSGTQAVAIAPSISSGSGAFTISSNCASVPAATGTVPGTCQISITFAPTTAGKQTAILTVSSTLTVALSGTGVPAGNFSVANVNLGDKVLTNTAVTGAVTVTITGNVTDLACSVSGADLTADSTKVCGSTYAAPNTCTVGFTFKATTSGAKSDSVTCNAAGLSKTAVVTATVVDTAKLAITPPKGDFQTQNGVQSADVPFGVANVGGLSTGTIQATITGANADQFLISDPGCLAPLAGTTGCSLKVACKPTSVGTKTASLSVADSSGAAATVTAALSCVSVGPTSLTVTGTANLGSVVIGGTGTPQSFTVTNTGSTASGKLTVAIGDAAEFVKGTDGCSGASLDPNATCSIVVSLHPTTAGALGAILSVTPASGNPGSIQLSGIGLTPGALTLSPPSWDFGSIPINTVGSDVNFTVTNGGGAATGALSVLPPGSGFVVAGNGCSAVLQPKGTCVFAIHYAPTVQGIVKTSVTVTDQIVVGSAILNGTATPAATLTISPLTTCAAAANDLLSPPAPKADHALHDSPSCDNPFKATVIGQTNGSYPGAGGAGGTGGTSGSAGSSGTSSGVTFTVTNQETSGIDTGTITIEPTGAAAGDFVISSNNCPVTLNPGDACMVTVDFTPTAAGLRSATLQVTTVKGGNASASLNGLGLPFIEILPCSNMDGTIVGGDPNNPQFPPSDPALYGTCTPLDSSGGTKFGQVPLNVLDPSNIPNQEKAFVVRVRGSNSTKHTNKLTVGLTTPTSAADFSVSTTTTNTTPCTDATMDVSTGMQQCVVVLDFFPQSGVGDKTGTLTITGSDGGSASVSLSGTATGPLYFNPSPVDFGSVNVGTVSSVSLTTTINGDTAFELSPVTVTVYNYGAAAQGPLSFAVTGANAAEFALVDDNCSDQTLAAKGDSCDLTYIMIPTSVGAKAATLTVTAGTLTSTVQFQGNGVNPAGAALSIAMDPNAHVFPSQPANTASAYQVFTVSLVGTTETGNINYELQTVGGGGFCNGKTKCLGFELAQGGTEGAVGTCGVSDTKHLGTSSASCTIKVRFRPTTSNGSSRAVNLVVWDANAPGQTFIAPLTGTVTSQLVVSPAKYDFGSVPELGKSQIQLFTVTNAGTTLFSSSGLVSFSGSVPMNTNGPSTTCGTTLSAGATCVVAVSIDPAPDALSSVDQYLYVGDATAELTATIVKPAHISVVGFDADILADTGEGLLDLGQPAVVGYNYVGNLVADFGTVVKGGSSNSFTITYINDGEVPTTALHYLWNDKSVVSPGVLAEDKPHPYFPFPSDSSTAACVNANGVNLASLLPGKTCTVTFSLTSGGGVVGSVPSYYAQLVLSADNAVTGDSIFPIDNAVTAQGWYAPSTGGTHITPSFFNFSPTTSTAVGSSTTAQVFTLVAGTEFAGSPLKGFISQDLTGSPVLNHGSGDPMYLFPNNGDFVVTDVGTTGCIAKLASAGGMVSGDTCTFSVTFTPQTGKDTYRIGQLAVANDAGVYAVAGVEGKVQKPATLSFSAASGGSNDFGDVVYNVRSGKKTMTITNTGEVASGTLTLAANAYVSGALDTDAGAVTDAGRFAVGAECNKVLNPADVCTFTISVLPGKTGVLPTASGYDIMVSATSTNAKADVIGVSGNLVARGVEPAGLSITPTNAQDFGNRAVGTTSATVVTVTIQNGNAGATAATQNSGPLTIKIDDPNNFDLTTSGCSTQTDPNGPGLVDASSCMVTIAFTPVAMGSHSAILSVKATNDAASVATPLTLQVKGTGIAALAFVTVGTGTPSDPAQFMTLAAATTDFGSIPVGSAPIFAPTDGPQVLEFWVENALGAPDTGLLTTTLAGSDFRLILNNCVGAKLGYDNNPNGGSEFCNMWVRFEPSSASATAKTGSLTVSGSPGNSATIQLKGTGT